MQGKTLSKKSEKTMYQNWRNLKIEGLIECQAEWEKDKYIHSMLWNFRLPRINRRSKQFPERNVQKNENKTSIRFVSGDTEG